MTEGRCHGEQADVDVARVRYQGRGVAYFSWNPGADPEPLVDVARSMTVVASPELIRCCELLANAKSVPPAHRDRYVLAASLCVAHPTRETMTSLRAALAGTSLASACR